MCRAIDPEGKVVPIICELLLGVLSDLGSILMSLLLTVIGILEEDSRRPSDEGRL
jgi:hypothetical protein